MYEDEDRDDGIQPEGSGEDSIKNREERIQSLRGNRGWWEFVVPYIESEIARLDQHMIGGHCKDWTEYRECVRARQSLVDVLENPKREAEELKLRYPYFIDQE